MTIKPRVVVVTPNPAVDLTYECAEPRLGQVNRVDRVVRRAGGKGLNVAAVLVQLGLPVRATGFLGGPGGDEIRGLLSETPIQQGWAPIAGSTRSTTVIAAATTTTVFNEPGPAVTAADWRALTQLSVGGLGPGDVLVLAGSCPPGTSSTEVTALLCAARSAGARTIVDTSGPLLLAAAAGADLMKPNREELAQATGLTGLADGARRLIESGAGAVVVSAGEDGLDLFRSTPDGLRRWQAAPARVVQGNPTGAGDAAVAALAASLLADPTAGPLRPEALAPAVALSAAAVLTPVAGVVDLDAYHRFLPDVKVSPIHVSG
ncbi:MAG: hexose kinase [Propionibacteriaceae bacterium]|jgi:1-phosphofructokinase/tagatose 6-phosphate kinase|nr:hexose kinase [Propionibacteriaceae bacterium]